MLHLSVASRFPPFAFDIVLSNIKILLLYYTHVILFIFDNIVYSLAQFRPPDPGGVGFPLRGNRMGRCPKPLYIQFRYLIILIKALATLRPIVAICPCYAPCLYYKAALLRAFAPSSQKIFDFSRVLPVLCAWGGGRQAQRDGRIVSKAKPLSK